MVKRETEFVSKIVDIYTAAKALLFYDGAEEVNGNVYG